MVKLIVYCPVISEGPILDALKAAGIGQQGAYDCWSIGFDVTERYRPLANAQPHSGQIGILTEQSCRRLEFHVPKNQYLSIIQQIKAIHPYEVPAIEVTPLLYPASDSTDITADPA